MLNNLYSNVVSVQSEGSVFCSWTCKSSSREYSPATLVAKACQDSAPTVHLLQLTRLPEAASVANMLSHYQTLYIYSYGLLQFHQMYQMVSPPFLFRLGVAFHGLFPVSVKFREVWLSLVSCLPSITNFAFLCCDACCAILLEDACHKGLELQPIHI